MTSDYDLLVIGGGINGAAIARDAAGRGLAVLLVEQGDLAQGTSSASTKLIHGGLRYLEYGAYRLVRESLRERETMLAAAPHIIRPIRFIVPHQKGMRPWWMVRAGLWLYDLLGWGGSLPRSAALRLMGGPLHHDLTRGFAYWDAWVDDARLVVLNALDAAERGAEIATRTRLASARREGGRWLANIEDMASGIVRRVSARALVNAAGPWIDEVLRERLGMRDAPRARLIKGSHIVVPRLHDGTDAYLLQQPDGRVVFAIPYEREFTLIGTTDIPVDDPAAPAIDDREIAYLCEAVNRYFKRQVTPDQVRWTYSGVRSLWDDGASEAKAVTRDYVLALDEDGAPLLTVYGGKITTARALAEAAMGRLKLGGSPWTKGKPLPGGDFDGAFGALLADARARWPSLPAATLERMAHAYGSGLADVLGEESEPDPGFDGLSRAEADYLVTKEWARTAEDILWRRTKLGLDVGAATEDQLRSWLNQRR
jgi:glycerol-3-phosphate dehydrogenase